MKTAASVLFVLLLSAQTPVGQVFKLPLLIEHFIKHNQQYGTSLFSFIVDHYSQEHHDADQSEDRQLPFKSVVLLNLSTAIVPPLVKPDFEIEQFCTPKTPKVTSHNGRQHLCRIFHPPCSPG